jgi:hypothetical protein
VAFRQTAWAGPRTCGAGLWAGSPSYAVHSAPDANLIVHDPSHEGITAVSIAVSAAAPSDGVAAPAPQAASPATTMTNARRYTALLLPAHLISSTR